MAKRLYTAEQAAAILQEDSDSSSECEDLDESDAEWLPMEESDSFSESDSDSESSKPPPAQRARREVQGRGRDTESASEGGSPVPTTSNANVRGQSAARPKRSKPVREHLPNYIAHPQWSTPNKEAPNIPPFTARSGLLVNTQNMQPSDYFSLFLTDTFLDCICEQTNLYTQQKIADNPTAYLARKWVPTTTPELKVFLGLTFNMGLAPKPKLCQFWSIKSIHCMPIYSAAMPRGQYTLLLRCLHFNNNEEQLHRDDPAFDQLFKLRPIIKYLNETFKEAYMPEQNLAIEESLVPFHGRLGIKQYIPNKRACYGIKVYKLCESGSGYTFTFKIYEGKDSLIEPAGCPPYMGTIERTPACGTVRANRKGLPPQVVSKKFKKGETCSQRSNELLALKFKVNRDVLVLTTIHSEATTTVRSRREHRVKPVAIVDYNKFMGAVDLAGQVMAPYRIDRKRKAWYKKVAINLMQVLYKKSGNKGAYLDFLEEIITSLIHESGQPATNQDLVSENVIRLEGNHFPAPITPTPSKKYPPKKCKICRKNGVRRDTRNHCQKCPSKLGLCLNPCFEVYHTAVRF
ncbi:piggyBac transposable element-derived protein 4-like [Hyperolius riggenbachi]|uniref:piggyBac transposable element-derived protein 4-like n=1 Tax=Hyperolius riggenbachi TaxID=752182 RepID=UPI0035A34DB9